MDKDLMRDMAEKRFRTIHERKTENQIKKEIVSLQKYMERHSRAYHWHGAGMTPPGCLADGDKMLILKEILSEKRIITPTPSK